MNDQKQRSDRSGQVACSHQVHCRWQVRGTAAISGSGCVGTASEDAAVGVSVTQAVGFTMVQEGRGHAAIDV